MKRIQVGTSDFKELIENGYLFIDKSLFIKEILEDGAKVTLIPRPRRFGKTLNMSMVKYFFDNKEDNSGLFKNLKIEKEKDIMRKQGKHPVIFLSFKEVKANNINDLHNKVKETITNEYLKHEYLLKSEYLNEYEKGVIKRFMEGKGELIDYEKSLSKLMSYLRKHFDKQVLLLIDEYDIPIQEGYLNNFYQETVEFMRNLLSSMLKDNTDLYKGVLTGILKIAKESIFSGLNNIVTYTLLEKRYNKSFGFTENEVVDILNMYGLIRNKEEVQNWYNGYEFGGETIYNPWSVLNYINNIEDGIRPYWANTSGNDLIKEILIEGGHKLKSELELLINGESLRKNINSNIVMNEVKNNTENIWSFLLFSGYLKCINNTFNEGLVSCDLKIPNKEVKYIYEEIILKWFKETLRNDEFDTMLKALITGDIETFEIIFADIVEKSLSYFDIKEDGENFYHAFVLGMLVSLNKTHRVKSNRESGYGRYDVMIIPKEKSKLAIIMEFKKVNKRKKETLEMAVETALKQIEEKNYKTELLDEGITKIISLGIAFDGKEIMIKEICE